MIWCVFVRFSNVLVQFHVVVCFFGLGFCTIIVCMRTMFHMCVYDCLYVRVRFVCVRLEIVKQCLVRFVYMCVRL